MKYTIMQCLDKTKWTEVNHNVPNILQHFSKTFISGGMQNAR